jgi:hypothetical protein
VSGRVVRAQGDYLRRRLVVAENAPAWLHVTHAELVNDQAV